MVGVCLTARAATQNNSPKAKLTRVPPASTRRVSALHSKCTVESASGCPPVARHMPPCQGLVSAVNSSARHRPYPTRVRHSPIILYPELSRQLSQRSAAGQ